MPFYFCIWFSCRLLSCMHYWCYCYLDGWWYDMVVLYYLSEQYITMYYRYNRFFRLKYCNFPCNVSVSPLTDHFSESRMAWSQSGGPRSWPPFHSTTGTHSAAQSTSSYRNSISTLSRFTYVIPGSLPSVFVLEVLFLVNYSIHNP